MKIRQSELKDLPDLMEMYAYARTFMQQTGNPNQWINGYPSEELIRSEIEAGHSYILEDETGTPVGTFCFILGEDPTYRTIEGGAWLNDEPYGTIHRAASNGKAKGIFDRSFAWCTRQAQNIRADTHKDNRIMQSLLEKNGFVRCGIIYVSNGTPRIAYHYAGTPATQETTTPKQQA